MIENKLDYSLLGSTEENPRLYPPGTDDQLSWKAPEERGLRRASLCNTLPLLSL